MGLLKAPTPEQMKGIRAEMERRAMAADAAFDRQVEETNAIMAEMPIEAAGASEKQPALFVIDGVEFLEPDVPVPQVAWKVRLNGDEFFVCTECPDLKVDFADLVKTAGSVYWSRRNQGKPPTWPE